MHTVILKHERKRLFNNELEKYRVDKINEILFYECPLSFITGKTWKILRLINATADGDGNITVLPFDGSYTDQPDWYKEALTVVKTARAENQKNRLR